MQLRVQAIRPLTADIRGFELVDPAGGELPAFTAGAHLKVRVLPAAAAVSTRSYSLVGSPHERSRYEIGVLHQRGGLGGSAWMHEAVAVGDVLDINGPTNAFALVPEAQRSVLLAGGIGITPILCMARELVARGQAVALHYFGRSLEAMAYLDELRALPGLALHEWVGLDIEASVRTMQRCIGTAGTGDHLYVCGPGAMLESALGIAAQQRWPAAQVHFERFGAAPGGAGDEAFTVQLLQSKLRLEVGRQQTLLDALLAHGVDVAHDCRAGICGSCLVPVAGGRIQHRDTFLTDDDRAGGDLMCACVSRATGELTLDI
ncbi:MAG: PDR/VanB family oxidoreductase [Burkholderiaceae bacterium]